MIGFISYFVWGYKQVKISMEFFGLINQIVDFGALTSLKVCTDVGTILVTMICLMVSYDTRLEVDRLQCRIDHLEW